LWYNVEGEPHLLKELLLREALQEAHLTLLFFLRREPLLIETKNYAQNGNGQG
jgi:hypothetical protein